MKMTNTPKLLVAILATSLITGSALAQPGAAPQPEVSLEACVTLVQSSMGGETTHLEFESRGGIPVYEFIVESETGPTYYVGCDATTGMLAEVDVIVEEGDERFVSLAQLDAQQAADAATRLYPGEVEEVKALLLSTGEAVYEVDVEVEPQGEFNVYINAETGRLHTVNIEYWEIGQSATASDQLGESNSTGGESGGGD